MNSLEDVYKKYEVTWHRTPSDCGYSFHTDDYDEANKVYEEKIKRNAVVILQERRLVHMVSDFGIKNENQVRCFGCKKVIDVKDAGFTSSDGIVSCKAEDCRDKARDEFFRRHPD